jgi:hypothetical protein
MEIFLTGRVANISGQFTLDFYIDLTPISSYNTFMFYPYPYHYFTGFFLPDHDPPLAVIA